MAQLKNTTVSGNLQVSASTSTNELQFKVLRAPTVSNGSTYSIGANGYTIVSNGSSIYWTQLIPLPVTSGGTGSTTVTGAQTNLGIVYSATEPSAPYEGMIWLKPVS